LQHTDFKYSFFCILMYKKNIDMYETMY
jgi:hypothetical protein